MTDRLARALLERRHAALALLVLLAAWALWSARGLEARFDPEELVAVEPAVAEGRAIIEQAFGRAEPPIIVIVDSREGAAPIVSTDGLAFLHGLARGLEEVPGVTRVEGLTTSRVPTTGDEAETLDSLDGVDTAMPQELRTVVEAEPERFPAGMLSVAGPVSFATLGGEGALTAEQAERARAVLAEVPLLHRRLVSDDGRVAVLAVLAEEGTDVLEGVRAECARHTWGSARVEVSGLPAMRAEMTHALEDDQVQLIGLALLGTIVVLVLGMRSVAGVLLPLGAVGLALALTLGLMAWTGTSLNLLTNMLPPLLLTIGLAEAMHVVLRHGDETSAGRGRVEAAAEAARAMWLPSFVTTFTTAVGFAALVASESPALRAFGALAATASMISYGVTMVFVPAALPAFSPAAGRATSSGSLEAWLVWITDRSSRRPLWTVGLACLVGGLAAVVARGVVVESRLLDQFARGSEIARTCATLEAELDGFRSVELGLFGEPGTFRSVPGMAVLDGVAWRAREEPDVLRVGTAADLAHEALVRVSGDPAARGDRFRTDAEVAALLGLVAAGDSEIVRAFVTDDGSAARIELRVRDSGASRTLALVGTLVESARVVAQREGISMRTEVAGEAYVASRGLERIVRALGGLTAAVVTIFVVMALLFRSLRLGLLAVPPNAIPLALTLAYMVARGIALHAATVIVFTVTLGLAVDGTTHVVSRFREELELAEPNVDRAEILRRTVRGSGRAVLLSSLTLMVGYVVLLTSRFEPVRLFGELSLVAIAGATVSQTVFLPALLAVWGMPRVARQIERRPSNDEVKAASSGK